MRKIARVENWTFQTTSNYTAPENGAVRISGEVYNHPKIPDGVVIMTNIVGADLERFVSLSGRHYELGTPEKGTTRSEFVAEFARIHVGCLLGGNPMKVDKPQDYCDDNCRGEASNPACDCEEQNLQYLCCKKEEYEASRMLGECCEAECLERGVSCSTKGGAA